MLLHTLTYRDEAVAELQKKVYKLLGYGSLREKLIFKAPTGSGKTVALALLLRGLAAGLPHRHELPPERRRVAYLWMAPGRLHQQALGSLRRFFQDTREARPRTFDELAPGDGLQPQDVLFLNWASVIQADNRLVRPTERAHDLWAVLEATRAQDTTLVVIIDEEHLMATTGPRTEEFLRKVAAAVEVRVSATPLTKSAHWVEVDRHDVVKAEMIKKGIQLNPALDEGGGTAQHGRTADMVLLEAALAKRRELAALYAQEAARAGTARINPLLLIQLPSETKNLSADDVKIRDQITAYLTDIGISETTGGLAVWLSGEKENLDAIEAPDSAVEVLLFKQAIALGWDCPRAAVLLIFREMKQTSFAVQTVGRILRMPEQRHYAEERLNVGYVYTNLNKQLVTVVPEAADYLAFVWAERRDDLYLDAAGRPTVELPTTTATREGNPTRITSKFTEALYAVAQARYGLVREAQPGGQPYEEFNRARLRANLIELDVENLPIEIPANVRLDGTDVEAVNATGSAHFVQTPEQARMLFERFCYDSCGDYARDGSHERIRYALKIWFDEWMGHFEQAAYRIVLHNRQAFTDLLALARTEYAHRAEQAAQKVRKLVSRTWQVPTPRRHDENDVLWPAQRALMAPLLLRARDPHDATKLADSAAEFAFIQRLDASGAVRWWYKNGQQGAEHLAVPYQVAGDPMERLFYPDFVVQFADGTVGLFDPKTPGSDAAVAPKHNALAAYVAARAQQGARTVGGVALWHQDVFRVPPLGHLIPDDRNVSAWDVFDPARYAD